MSDERIDDEAAHRRVIELNQRLQRNIFSLVYDFVTFPVVVVALLHNPRIHPAYGMTWARKFTLGWRMYRNSFRIISGTTWKAHLAMALKLLEIPPEVEGVVVECGCFQGGSSANLSLACEAVGRDLIVYDSFEGLPVPAAGEKYGIPGKGGGFRGTLETVRANIGRGGAIDRCTFRKGWFRDTLPDHSEPVVLCFIDVDYQASLHDCITNLWPHLVDHGYVFIDEYVLVDYCSLFFSERFWRTNFDTTPPGLIGAGSGIALGQYFVGPIFEHSPFQTPESIAYTYKGSSGFWDFYPDDPDPPAD
jgi:O-methyltransferase